MPPSPILSFRFKKAEMSPLTLRAPENAENTAFARNFCEEFLGGKRPTYVLGRNNFCESILENGVRVDGVIDDFTSETSFHGIPVVNTDAVPKDALVLSASSARPVTARKRLRDAGLAVLDYYAFRKHSGLPLADMLDVSQFPAEFEKNREKFETIYAMLEDEESREVFRKLVNFRLSADLDFMEGFVLDEAAQYFEDFLDFRNEGESFVDAGSYNGFSSLGFIKRCPNYASIHVFEPEPANYELCQKALAERPNIKFYKAGLSDKNETLFFVSDGTASRISDTGTSSIEVRRLDDTVDTPYSFLKMDIEGAEISAIRGAAGTIAEHHPRLAICVYHLADDFWKIPETVFSIRSDYRIRIRHYSEGLIESVMYFLPVK